jgi:AraC family transcriptional regulator
MNGEPRFGDEASAGAASSRHLMAVERVIAAMHRREDGALRLRTMAEMANLSPYHFARTFRDVTGIPPGEFLTAVRLERAKRLLLGTDLSVAEVCFEVGYESVGTFAARFKDLAGLPPGRMRRLPEELHAALGHADGWYQSLPSSPEEVGVAFRVHGPDLPESIIFAGLFPGAVPQGRPVAGTVLGAPGSHRLYPGPDGHYHLMAAALPRSEDPWKLLAPGDALRVGRAPHPLAIRGGRVGGQVDVALRPVRPTDPPVLVAHLRRSPCTFTATRSDGPDRRGPGHPVVLG